MKTVLPRPTSDFEKTLPTEIAFADDVDFIGLEFADIAEVQKTLEKYKLLVNADKTEQTTLSRSGKNYKNAKKVGTLIGDEEDINRRKRLSTAALAKLQNIWIKGDKVKRKTKIKLYRTLVKSVMTYTCGTWALTKAEEEKLNALHRHQLRKILNIKTLLKSQIHLCTKSTMSVLCLSLYLNVGGACLDIFFEETLKYPPINQ